MSTFPGLQTNRLLLRALTLGDEAGLFAIYSNPNVTRFCDVVTLENHVQARLMLEVFQSEPVRDAGVRWAIVERGATQLIGVCGLGWYRHNRSALLSYDLNEDHWNRGIMTEAVEAVVRYAFEQGTNRITATTVVDNPASVRVLQHVGFREEGILRQWGFWGGKFVDLRCFSLLRLESELTPRLQPGVASSVPERDRFMRGMAEE
jgi:[ribosomal protein S5]-alanine N-acetyltransferase